MRKFCAVMATLSTLLIVTPFSAAAGAPNDISTLPAAARATIYATLERNHPTLQMATLTNTNPGADDDLGYSVAIFGNTIVVGDPSATVNGISQGAVYVFVKPEGGWDSMTQTAELTASDGMANALFGGSVAIADNAIVVGADNEAANGQTAAGEAYVFVKPADGWADATETATLLPRNAKCPVECNFGASVSISSETVLVGAPGATGEANASGTAYVFVKPSSGWKNMAQTAELTSSDSNTNALFGGSVAIGGDLVAVGASDQDGGYGRAYVFVAPASGWKNMTQTAELSASSETQKYHLGKVVAISGNTIAATAPDADSGAGAVYVYAKPASGWIDSSETAQLTNARNTEIGYSLAFNGNEIATAGITADIAYIYARPAGGWATTARSNFSVTNGDSTYAFGASIALSGQTVVVGAPKTPNPGAAYVFTPE